MKRSIFRLHVGLILGWLVVATPVGAEDKTEAPDGWRTRTPRDEIRPAFAYHKDGGPKGKGSLVIEADQREGLFGWWEKTFPVKGGHYYRFSVLRRTRHIELARRTLVERVLWRDANGKPVEHDELSRASFEEGKRPRSEPEYPSEEGEAKGGWTTVSGIYLAPSGAAQAIVELSYNWEPAGRVEWADVTLQETPAPAPRTVRLATIHYCPGSGTTSEEKCRQFEPLIEEAARQRADLIVLP